ncbi:MAG: DEAD/DEAH box helicase [Acidiferrobacter sp.]
MPIELGILPSGTLHCARLPDDAARDPSDVVRIGKAFARHTAEGLLTLAAHKDIHDLPPSWIYWRQFACQYLQARCLLTAADTIPPEPVEALSPAAAEALLTSVPPMRGAEYLSTAALLTIWTLLDRWVCEQIGALGGLSAFLAQRAPQWHGVGRVCFHLAENKGDADYPFAFIATYAAQAPTHHEGRVRHRPLSQALQEYAGAHNKAALIRLLSPVHQASQLSPLIQELAATGDLYQPLAWTPAEAYKFLKEIPLYERAGVVVRLPDWWQKRRRPRVRVTIGDQHHRPLGIDTLLDFQIAMVLDDAPLTERELQELMAMGEGLAFIKGHWVEVDHDQLDAALAHWQKVAAKAGQDGLSFIEGMRLLAGAPIDLGAAEAEDAQRVWSFAQPGRWLATLFETSQSTSAAHASDPGRALQTTLRPYQQRGVDWLWQLSQWRLGACLADDMGLGKTIQIIALLLVGQKHGGHRPSLLVLPASLLANWEAELARFGPSLRCLFVHASQQRKNGRTASSAPDLVATGVDLVLTTYGTLPRASWLQEQPWRWLILDEAQAIKNPIARQTRVIKTLKAEARIALTGTPIENRLSDLWSLFDFLNPGLLGSAIRFKTFVNSLDPHADNRYAPLRNLVRPYILRRLKTDRWIIADLPEKTEVPAYCALTKIQAAQYEQAVRELTAALRNQDGMKRRGLVLAYLLRFKQICNHPSQRLGDGVYDPRKSGKFMRLAELCEEIAARQEKLLVFTQFREMTTPLATFLATRFREPGLVLHGGTPVGQRQKLVERFQQEAGPPFFVLSLKAGGTGLNLTAASQVIHFDRWWNPAVENQATDRAFRIGQQQNVMVHKFICPGTMEEKIDALIHEKTALSHDLLEGGVETLLTEMDNNQLLHLVALDIDRAHVGAAD